MSMVPLAEDRRANPPIFLLLLTATFCFKAATAPFHKAVYRNLCKEDDFCSDESSIDADSDDDASEADDDDIGVGRICSDGFSDAPTSRAWRLLRTGFFPPPAV